MEIRLTRGLVALVDDCDAELLLGYAWYACCSSKVYAMAKVGAQSVLMHRLIMNPPSDRIVDHANGHTLDNRRHNLRLATSSQNSANQRPARVHAKSGFKGVLRRGRGWAAKIQHQGQQLSLGQYETAEDAAYAYDAKARELFGDFAATNFAEQRVVVTWRAKAIAAVTSCRHCGKPINHRSHGGQVRKTCSEYCRRMSNYELALGSARAEAAGQ